MSHTLSTETPLSPGLCATAELGMTALQSIHTECDVHGTKLLQARACWVLLRVLGLAARPTWHSTCC